MSAVRLPGKREPRSNVSRRSSSRHAAPSRLRSRETAVPVLIAAVLGANVTAGTAWVASAKTVTLSVDGQLRQVDFRGSTVGDLLATAGLSVGEHDLVVPGESAALEDGAKVAVRRGREIELVVDGQPRRVWVTAASVDEALAQVGLREENLALSVSRSSAIPLDGFRLQVITSKRITVLADNAAQERETTAATVAEALAELGLVADGDDRLSALSTDPVTEGMSVRLVRVVVEQIEEQAAVPFETVQRRDPALPVGQTKELTAGKEGVMRRTVERVIADGVLEKSTVLSATAVSAPVSRVVAVGTKPRSASAPAPAPAPAPARRGTAGADSLNWAALARCESGGNPRALSPGGRYRGLYQFSLATWRGIGGSGDPIENSPEEQTYRAKLLYQRSGAGQWPHCGPRLFS